MSRTQEKALATCDGVIEIAKNEMLVRGNYITGIVDDKLKQQGAICGGRQACLVGSLYLAHGVPDEGWGEFFFETFLRSRPNAVVLAEVVQVSRSAKRLIRSGAVTPRGVR
jgi:hypothetical protein